VARQNGPGASAPGSPAAPASPFSLAATDSTGHMRKFEELEADIIRMAIHRYDGHMSEVARRLGIGRSTLYRKLKEFGLEPDGAAHPTDTAPDLEEAIRQAG